MRLLGDKVEARRRMMAAGVPVIGTNVAGIRDVIVDGRTGEQLTRLRGLDELYPGISDRLR